MEISCPPVSQVKHALRNSFVCLFCFWSRFDLLVRCDGFSSISPSSQLVDSTVFTKAIVMTDGLCGSTCAVFSSHITAVNHVTSVVTGGIASVAKQQYFSFPGGLVYNLDSLINDVTQLGLKSYPYVPAALPGGGRLTFTLLEIYDWQNTNQLEVPLEFLFRPAEHVIPNWCYDDSCRPALYKQVSSLFKTVG